MRKGNDTLFYHYNAHGDVIALTNQQGEVVARYEYDAWGNSITVEEDSSVANNPFRYAGYQYDHETGMYYLIARYYHPEQGVFLSLDPDPGDDDDILTQNGYTYANNNPVMLVDPDGHWVWFAVNAGFAAYEGYKAYKSGKGWKGVAWAVGSNFLKVGYIKKASKVANAVNKYRGRAGKQKRLRELANDPKLSRALRGEIKRDINEIKRGKRKNIRVPQGYHLAHRRGYEANKGFGYKYSDLQIIKNHRTQHKHDGYGKKKKLRR